MKIRWENKFKMLLLLFAIPVLCLSQTGTGNKNKLLYINTSFENASTIDWEIDSNGVVQIGLIYDHERNSPNRANGHWHFQLQGIAGTDVDIELRNFDNIWNGVMASPVSEKTNFIISEDDIHWTFVPGTFTASKHLKARLHLRTGNLYVASVEPYRISDLDRFIKKIKDNPLVNISSIGKTVEGRPLEIIRVGNPASANNIVIRARAHSWEPGGNWIVEGLVNTLLNKDSSGYLKKYCVYIMPMANKDGVAHGRTRFNSNGVDLNRQWDVPADSILAPEKFAFEKWLQKMIAMGKKPQLAIDLHNDEGGNLHLNTPNANNSDYSNHFKTFEQLLYKYTWFREGPVYANNKGSLGEGLASRFGIDACILEFNYEWSIGLKKVPMGKDWQLFGSELKQVFAEYFAGKNNRAVGAGSR